jgi:hypothetical protein
MSEINVLLKATDEASKTIADAGNKINGSLKEVEDAGKRVSQAQKQSEASTKDLALGFNNAAASAFSLYDAVDRVQDMQVSLDRANLQVKSSLNSVEDAQRRLNATVEKYGADSDQAKAAADDLKLAQDRYQVSVERAEMLQGNMNEAITRSALQVIPSCISMVDSLNRVWKNFPDVTGMLSKVSSRIGDVGISAKTAALGVGGFIGGFLAGDALLKALPENLRGIASALMAGIAAVVAATVAWMAFQGTVTLGVAVPVILAAVGAGIAGIKGLIGLAEGGIVTKPTLALIGEAGAEAVIPLNKMQSSSGATSQTLVLAPTFNFPEGSLNPNQDPREFAEAVYEHLSKIVRSDLKAQTFYVPR